MNGDYDGIGGDYGESFGAEPQVALQDPFSSWNPEAWKAYEVPAPLPRIVTQVDRYPAVTLNGVSPNPWGTLPTSVIPVRDPMTTLQPITGPGGGSLGGGMAGLPALLSIPGIGTIIMQFIQTGAIKAAIAWIASFVGRHKVLAAIGALLAAGVITKVVYDLLNREKKRRRRRLSIGYNPRLGTLIKVAKHTDKLTKKFGNRMRHAGLIRTPRRTQYHPMIMHHSRRH